MPSSLFAPLRGFTIFAVAFLATSSFAAPPRRSLVERPDTSENVALLVGVAHGLPGIDLDLKDLSGIARNPAYHFQVTELADEDATVSDLQDNLEALSRQAGRAGTLLFYYTGHGAEGEIWPYDDYMGVDEIRQAIEEGRKSQGPLQRLVMIYDSCYSGSLLGPMRTLPPLMRPGDPLVRNGRFADAVVRSFSRKHDDSPPYWSKLMVIASSRDDETSLSSAKGSIFTRAFAQAFEQTVLRGGTNGDLLRAAQELTVELGKTVSEVPHHPVARFVPQSLSDEPLVR